MIANDQELQVTLERIARFQAQVAHLRKTETSPANYHAAASGFRARSELVAAADPVMPVFDRLRRLLVGMDGLQLRERRGQVALVPADRHEDLVLADLLPRHVDNLDLVVDLQRRSSAFGNADGLEREPELVLEVIVPAHGPLFLVVGIGDDPPLDALLTFGIDFWFCHGMNSRVAADPSRRPASAAARSWSEERPKAADARLQRFVLSSLCCGGPLLRG